MPWLPIALCAGLGAAAVRAQGATPETSASAKPSQSPLVLRFDASAASLPTAAIREAIVRVLARPIAEVGAPGQPQLELAFDPQHSALRMRYHGPAGTLERELPWRSGSAAQPAQVERAALLAQNLVTDQAGQLLAQPGEPALPPARPATSAHAAQHRSSPAPSARPTVTLLLQAAAFSNVRLHHEIERATASPTVGLAARFEYPLHPQLMLGWGAALQQWEGGRVPEEKIVNSTMVMDVLLSVRPRIAIDALELSLVLAAGPALVESVDAQALSLPQSMASSAEHGGENFENAYPPGLGLAAGLRGAARYFVSADLALTLELGAEYHHASAREHMGPKLSLDLLQPQLCAGVAFVL